MLYPYRASFSLWTAVGTVVILTYIIGCSHADVYSQSDNANCSEVCQDNCYNTPSDTYACPCGCLEPNSNIKWPPVETAVWYIVADFLPLLFVIPIILLFNINLAFGPGHCLVFSYQILGCYVIYYYYVTGPYSGNSINPIYSGILNIFGLMVFHNPVLEAVALISSSGPSPNPPPNPTPNPYSFPTLILSYVKVVLAILYFVSILFLVSRSRFPFERGSISWSKLRRTLRRFREKHAYEGSVLVGTTSILILIFGYVVEISFNLLSMGGNNECNCESSFHINPYHRALAGYNSQSFPINIATDFIGYGSPYIAIPAISLLLLLFSSLALIYYPAIQNVFYYVCKCNCPRLTKLDPVIDVLQGGYKLRLRFFAGIYLLYRILIWSIWAFVIDASVRQFILTYVITIISLVHSIFQPFRQKRHNYFESLNLLTIILASFGSNALVVIDDINFDFFKYSLNITFLAFPGALVIFYYTVHL